MENQHDEGADFNAKSGIAVRWSIEAVQYFEVRRGRFELYLDNHQSRSKDHTCGALIAGLD
jgi:hypothetical protein